MRILINGVYIGGNCPPFYYNLKKIGHQVKIIDVTYFNQHYKNFSELISTEDIIFPSYTRLDFICYKLFEKTGISFFLFPIIKKLKNIVSQFNPDLIINHQMSKRANLMLDTGFKPQAGVIYGSEIKGKNILMNSFKKAVDQTGIIMTTTQDFKNKIVAVYPDSKKKVRNVLYSFFSCKEVLDTLQNVNVNDVRSQLGFSATDLIVFDNRSMRDELVLKEALNGYLMAIKKSPRIKILLIKGFSGDQKLIEFAKQFSVSNGCSSNFKIIENSLSDELHYQYVFCSDIITSLLRADQFGEVIMHGMLLKKKLLLFELPQYKNVLNNNALYTNGSAADIFDKISLVAESLDNIDAEANYNFVINNLDAGIAFKKIDNLLNEIANEIY